MFVSSHQMLPGTRKRAIVAEEDIGVTMWGRLWCYSRDDGGVGLISLLAFPTQRAIVHVTVEQIRTQTKVVAGQRARGWARVRGLRSLVVHL